jgi:hypothetical protein
LTWPARVGAGFAWIAGSARVAGSAQVKDQSPLRDAGPARLLARCSLPRKGTLDAGFDAVQAVLANRVAAVR